MKTSILLFGFLFFSLSISAQYDYEASHKNPYGKLNPKAPKQTADFDQIIGESKCSSLKRNQDGTWQEPSTMLWRFKYIMNGMAVQDETLKEDGSYSGSIRQYSKDSLRWYVHYYSVQGIMPTLPAWEGNVNKEGNIILYRDQKAPNGMEGYYRITFSEMTPKSFNWIGEWVDKTEKIVYPTWKIACTKREEE